jgi:uncharacterized membrane protein YdjX (TVP38/TMEM64 family)
MSNVEADVKRKHSRWFYVVLGICFTIFILVGVIFYREVDPKAFHKWATDLPGWLVFVLLALLPLTGFPVSVLFVVAGAKFGSGWGTAIVAGSIVIHLLASFYLATHFLHDWMTALFRRTRYKMPQIPKGEHVPVTLLTTLVPGVPYAAKNYLLVLGGVPFRAYMLVCLPAHIFHASLAIFFGDLTRDLTRGRLIFLGTYTAIIILLGRYVVKRLRTRRSGKQ